MRSLYEQTPYKLHNTVISEPSVKDEQGTPIRTSPFYSAKHQEMLADYQKNAHHWSFARFKTFFIEGYLQHIVGMVTGYHFNIDYHDAINKKDRIPLRLLNVIVRIREIIGYFEIRICTGSKEFHPYEIENTFSRLMIEQSLLREVITPLLTKLKESKILSIVGAKSQQIKYKIDQLKIDFAQCSNIERRKQLQMRADNLQKYSDELDHRISSVVINYCVSLRRFIDQQLGKYFHYTDGCLEEAQLTELREIIRGFSAEHRIVELLSPFLTAQEKGGQEWNPKYMVEVKNPVNDNAASSTLNGLSDINGINYLFPFVIGLIAIAQAELSQPLASQPVYHKIAQLFYTWPKNVLESRINSFTFKDANNHFVHEFSEQLFQLLIKNRLATVKGGLTKEGFPFGFSAVSHITNLFWYYYDGTGAHHLENPAYIDEVTRGQIIATVDDIKSRESGREILVEKPRTRFEFTLKGKCTLVSYLMNVLNHPCHDNPSLMLNAEVMKRYTLNHLTIPFMYLYQLPDGKLMPLTLDNPIISFYVNGPVPAYGEELPSVNDTKLFILGMLKTVTHFKNEMSKGNKLLEIIASEKKLSAVGVGLLTTALSNRGAPKSNNAPASYQNQKTNSDENSNQREQQNQPITHSMMATSSRITTSTVSQQSATKNKSPAEDFELETFRESNHSENSAAPLLRRKDNAAASSAIVPIRSHYGALSIANKSSAENKVVTSTINNSLEPFVHSRSLFFYVTQGDILFLAHDYFNIVVNIFPNNRCPDDLTNPVIHILQVGKFWHSLIDPFPHNDSTIHEKFLAYRQYIQSARLSKSEIVDVLKQYVPGPLSQIVPELFKAPKRHLRLVNNIFTLSEEVSTTIFDVMTFLVNKLPWEGTLEPDFEVMIDYLCYRFYGKDHKSVADLSLNPGLLSTAAVSIRAVKSP